jgi:hypothetical protein
MFASSAHSRSWHMNRVLQEWHDINVILQQQTQISTTFMPSHWLVPGPTYFTRAQMTASRPAVLEGNTPQVAPTCDFILGITCIRTLCAGMMMSTLCCKARSSHHAFSLARTGSGMFLTAQTTAGGQQSTPKTSPSSITCMCCTSRHRLQIRPACSSAHTPLWEGSNLLPKPILDLSYAHAATEKRPILASHHAFSLARTGSGMFLRAQMSAGGQCSLRCSQP